MALATLIPESDLKGEDWGCSLRGIPNHNWTLARVCVITHAVDVFVNDIFEALKAIGGSMKLRVQLPMVAH